MPRFEERFTVHAPPDTVWAFLLDPKRLAPCIPGCDDLEVVEVDGHGLVVGPGVDAVLGPEHLGCPDGEVVEAVDHAADDVGDAARRVARPVALLERDDLE